MKRKKILSIGLFSLMMVQFASVSAFANSTELSNNIQLSSDVSQTESYPNVIEMRGLGVSNSKHGFDIEFDTNTKKIKVEKVFAKDYTIHPYFGGNTYMELKLYNKNGVEKESVTLTGNDLPSVAKDFDGTSFDYDDYLKVYHAEGGSYRYKVTGKVSGLEAKGNEYVYRITKTGLEQVKLYSNAIEMRGLGVSNSKHGFDIKFDISNEADKKIKVDEIFAKDYTIHPYFGNGTYMEVKLYGENNVEKKSVTLVGNDLPSVAKELDQTPFEYNDYLEIYHAEGGSYRYNVLGKVSGSASKGNKYVYRITKTGLEQVR